MDTAVSGTGVLSGSAMTDHSLPPEEDTASPYCLSLLRAACRNVASPDLRSPQHRPRLLGDVTMAVSDVITNGPRRTRPLAARFSANSTGMNVSVDADAFFEYDLECGVGVSPAVGVASTVSHAHAAEEGGADTGCALTSPTDGSREASNTTSPLVDACLSGNVLASAIAYNAKVNDAAAPCPGTASSTPTMTAPSTELDTGVFVFASYGDGVEAIASDGKAGPTSGGTRTFYQTNHRHIYENPLQSTPQTPPSSAPVAVPSGRRSSHRDFLRRGVAEVLPPSPSEKVDAWLRACDAAGGDEITSEDLVACFGPVRSDSPSPLQENAEKTVEVGVRRNALEEYLTDADELDIRGLLTKGCEMLDLTPDVASSERQEDEEQLPELKVVSDIPDVIPTEVQDESPLLLEEGGLDESTEVKEEVEEDEVTLDEDEQTASLSFESSDFQSPNRYKRCSSLKSSKLPPLPPGRKKIVRFADALGLDLQQVRTFKQEVPTVPRSALAGLELDDLLVCGSPDVPSPLMCHPAARSCYPSGIPNGRRLVPLFLQPSVGRGFQDRLRRDKVAVVSVTCHEDDWSVRCLVSVLNMDYYKSVCVRHTLDEWRTWTDVSATYVQGSCDGLSDKFQFTLRCRNLAAGQRLHFAVAFRCQGREFWDNNGGANYTVLCAATDEGAPDDRNLDWTSGRF